MTTRTRGGFITLTPHHILIIERGTWRILHGYSRTDGYQFR